MRSVIASAASCSPAPPRGWPRAEEAHSLDHASLPARVQRRGRDPRFVDEDELASLECSAAGKGIPGGGVAGIPHAPSGRPDLVVLVDHYLRGRERRPFDLLY
jgi:hypothetical protein